MWPSSLEEQRDHAARMNGERVPSTYELHGREEKAKAIAAYLRSIGVTGDDIRQARGADDYEACWAQIAQLSGTRPASSETRKRVVEILEGR